MEEQLLVLWVSILSLTAAPVSIVTGPYMGQVVLPCSSEDNTINRIYWQREDRPETEVVKARCEPPKPECNIIHDNYINRSKFTEPKLEGNFSLTLLHIRLQDEGSYRCVLLGKRDTVDDFTVQLKVVAQYSQPVVTVPSLQNDRLGEEVSFTCTTTGGYPKGTVQWLNKTSNSYFSAPHVKTQVDGEMGSGERYHLFNVTSTLRVNASHDDIVCQIINTQTEEVIESKPVPMIGASPGSMATMEGTGTATEITASSIWCVVLANLYLQLDRMS